MEIVIASDVPPHGEGYTQGEGGIRAGVVVRQWLLRDETPDGLGFRLFRSTYKTGDEAFESPRHHHGFQQIRWTESGSVNFAPGQDIATGDIAYFPRGAFYGPQRKDQGVGWLLQFGFGDEYPASRKDRSDRERQGAEIMAAAAREGDGVAVMDAPTTSKAGIAAAGYEAPILMHPAAHAWFEVSPGVEMRRLGDFHDHPGPNADVRIAMLRLSHGGAHGLSPERAQLGWSVKAGLTIDGRTWPELTCFYSPLGEEAAISGQDGAEAYVVELPRLG